MKQKKNYLKITAPLCISALFGCAQHNAGAPVIPSEDYANNYKAQHAKAVLPQGSMYGKPATISTVAATTAGADAKAQYHFVNDVVTNDPNAASDVTIDGAKGVTIYRGNSTLTRDYQGPLDLGDPGVQASLWRETRGTNDILRDDRAWQAGDLITIAVTENDQGIRQALTNTKSENTLSASLKNLFGIAGIFNSEATSPEEGNIKDPTLITASSSNEFKGQGTTNRLNQLRGRLSVMVAEVLPTGILRIEGKKIVAVNDEEQVMMLSGLVRVRDINSANEVDSSKVANMRIDYFGKGTLDEGQTPPWGARLIRTLWPF
jgi:flagellar L-ring protein precursor FlgH